MPQYAEEQKKTKKIQKNFKKGVDKARRTWYYSRALERDDKNGSEGRSKDRLSGRKKSQKNLKKELDKLNQV